MQIDLNGETLLAFTEASKTFPGRPHIATLHRWRLRGIRGHRLDSVKIGGRRYTSFEALERFVAACSSTDADRVETLAARSRRRAKEIEVAERECEASEV